MNNLENEIIKILEGYLHMEQGSVTRHVRNRQLQAAKAIVELIKNLPSTYLTREVD